VEDVHGTVAITNLDRERVAGLAVGHRNGDAPVVLVPQHPDVKPSLTRLCSSRVAVRIWAVMTVGLQAVNGCDDHLTVPSAGGPAIRTKWATCTGLARLCVAGFPQRAAGASPARR
jgi:hypothetical protein